MKKIPKSNTLIDVVDLLRLDALYNCNVNDSMSYHDIYKIMKWRPDKSEKLHRYHKALKLLGAPLFYTQPSAKEAKKWGYKTEFSISPISNEIKKSNFEFSVSWANEAFIALNLFQTWIKDTFPKEQDTPWVQLDVLIQLTEAIKNLSQESNDFIDKSNSSYAGATLVFEFIKGKHRPTNWTMLKSIWSHANSGKKIHFDYFNRTTESKIRYENIIPIRLQCYQHTWYLLGVNSKNEVQKFSCDCISRIDFGNDFNPDILDSIIEPKKYFGIFGKIKDVKSAKIQFSERAWKWVKDEEWTLKQNRDPTTHTISFDYGHDEELVRTILSYGDEILHIDPPELRQKVIERAKTLIQNLNQEKPCNQQPIMND